MSANVNPNLPRLTKQDRAYVESLCAKYRYVVVAIKGTKVVDHAVSDTNSSPFTQGYPNGSRLFCASWS